MTPHQHYQQAERLLREASSMERNVTVEQQQNLLLAALTSAVLATIKEGVQ